MVFFSGTILVLSSLFVCSRTTELLHPLIDLVALEAHRKKEIKVERVLLDFVKDPLIHHLTENKTSKEMFDSLVSLFQSNNMNRKMVSRNKLRLV
jgi:hypothetical protein